MTDLRELLRDCHTVLTNGYRTEQLAVLERIEAALAQPEQGMVPVADAWMRRDGAIWEISARKVCEEQLGLKPVVLYVLPAAPKGDE